MLNVKNNQKGFVASIITVLALLFMVALGASMSSILLNRQQISQDNINSSQAYYTAESGIEDALLRLKKNPAISSLSYNLSINNSTTSITIPALLLGNRTILSTGTELGRSKKIQAIYSIGGDNVSFYYGVQVGRGGLQMSNGSEVVGSVFSDGDITGSGKIDSDVITATNHKLDGVNVGGNAKVYSCKSSSITGNLITTGGAESCTVKGSRTTQTDQVAEVDMPISQDQIDSWKDEASTNVMNEDVTIPQNTTQTMGPVKIVGSLTLNNKAILKLTGTIYVTGNITINNSSAIKLDSSYGALNGIIVSDGIININNGADLTGSGQAGSYILALSTNSGNPAISVNNNTTGAIFYTSAGFITLNNNASAKEVVGYGISLSNNVKIQYSIGLINMFFSSGPGGGWGISDWSEK